MAHQPTPREQRTADAACCRRIIRDLIELGSELVEGIHRQVMAQTPPTCPANDSDRPPDPIEAFERTARAIRRAILLSRQIGEHLPARTTSAQHRGDARQRMIREVEAVIQRSQEGADATPRRMDANNLGRKLTRRPVANVIADICRDLGFAMGGTRLPRRSTPKDIEDLCTRADGRTPRPTPILSIVPRES